MHINFTEKTGHQEVLESVPLQTCLYVPIANMPFWYLRFLSFFKEQYYR